VIIFDDVLSSSSSSSPIVPLNSDTSNKNEEHDKDDKSVSTTFADEKEDVRYELMKI
jgi:hypothetical protein